MAVARTVMMPQRTLVVALHDQRWSVMECADSKLIVWLFRC
jgi:hypothetical protein